MFAFLLIAALAYAAAAPDRRTYATSRGTASAGKAAAVGGARQIRADWQAGAPGRAKVYQRNRARLRKKTLGPALLAAWDGARLTCRGLLAADRGAYRAGRAAGREFRQAYRPAAEEARRKREERRQARRDKRQAPEADSVQPSHPSGLPPERRCEWCDNRPRETKRGKLHVCGQCAVDIDVQTAAAVRDHHVYAPTDPPAGTNPDGTTTPPTEGTDMNLSIKPTELTDTSALRGEAKEARQVFEELREAMEHVQKYLNGLGDRYAGAPFGTERLSRSVTALTEHAGGVDPAAVDSLLEDVAALEEALTEAENLGEHTSSVKAEGDVHAFQPA